MKNFLSWPVVRNLHFEREKEKTRNRGQDLKSFLGVPVEKNLLCVVMDTVCICVLLGAHTNSEQRHIGVCHWPMRMPFIRQDAQGCAIGAGGRLLFALICCGKVSFDSIAHGRLLRTTVLRTSLVAHILYTLQQVWRQFC